MSIYRSTAGQAAIRAWCTAQLDGWGLPHQRREVMTLAGPTHLVEAGSGTPVVVVPGTNFGAASMLALIGPLSREYRVIAPDLPGQPGLSGDTRHHDAAAFDGWLSAVVESTGIESPLVIGHSLGGMISLASAAGGAGVRGLLLIDPAGLVRLRVTPGLIARTLPWLIRPSASTGAGLLRAMAAPGWQPSPALAEWMGLVGRHVRSSLAPKPLTDEALKRIDAPVRVIAGEHDTFMPPRILQRGINRLPGTTFEVIPGAGHLLPEERPEAVVGALRAFAATL